VSIIISIAVVQYVENAGIIAVNYEAKAKGVTRHMREKEAKSVCSDLVCVKVPSKYGKADLTKYRSAGVSVAKVFQEFTPLLERASVDEG
jgi:DNA polymerase eta